MYKVGSDKLRCLCVGVLNERVCTLVIVSASEEERLHC